MQPAAWCQEPRGFGKRGVWRWKAPSAIIQAVPTQAQNTKRCQTLHTLLRIAISISVSLFANTELRERESHNLTQKYISTCSLALWPVHQGPVVHKVGYCYRQPKQKWAKFMCQHSDTKGCERRQTFLKLYSFPHINPVKHWRFWLPNISCISLDYIHCTSFVNSTEFSPV